MAGKREEGVGGKTHDRTLYLYIFANPTVCLGPPLMWSVRANLFIPGIIGILRAQRILLPAMVLSSNESSLYSINMANE